MESNRRQDAYVGLVVSVDPYISTISTCVEHWTEIYYFKRQLWRGTGGVINAGGQHVIGGDLRAGSSGYVPR